MTVDVAIVGGGIAGLAAAYYAQKQGLRYVLLEASERLGGKAQSEHVTGYGETPFVVEYGPDGFITRKPWAWDLMRELGAEVVPINETPERIYVLTGGKLRPLPDGLHLLVPTKLKPFLQSDLFSWPGKLRVLAERYVPVREATDDESVADFIRRRFGAEALDKLGEPVLAGVYNANAEQMSMHATFKQFPALEAQYGSVIRGMVARRQPANGNGHAKLPPLAALRDGMEGFATAIADQLIGDVRTGAPVNSVVRDGRNYILAVEDTSIAARATVLATPATITASLIGHVAPQAATTLSEIRTEGVGSVGIAYRAVDVPHPLDAYGIVIPSSEGRRIDGITFASSKWANRAPAGHHLFRVFFGGPNTRHLLNLPDEAVAAIVREELHDILGITAEPLFYRIARWQAAYPQYDVGHMERVATAQAALPDGMQIAGLSYFGVGIPDTVNSAKTAIENILLLEGETV